MTGGIGLTIPTSPDSLTLSMQAFVGMLVVMLSVVVLLRRHTDVRPRGT